MSITGNCMVDHRYMEAPGNVVLEAGRDLTPYRAWASAIKNGGSTVAILQISHSGRQTPASVTRSPVAPSAVPFQIQGMGPLLALARATPIPLTEAQILEIIQRFATTAKLAEEAGFDGVEIHGAHGYLISQFLSANVNLRTDRWGGTPENRRRFLLEVVRAVRGAVSPGFVVGLKLNSADFQRGGLSKEESVDVLRTLAAGETEAEVAAGGFGLDFVEVSGGTYENMEAMKNVEVRASTRAREGFFVEFAEMARKHVASDRLPLLVTGGFRSARGMNAALASGAVSLIGMARPVCVEPDLPRRLIADPSTIATPYSLAVGFMDKAMVPSLNNFWHQRQMRLMAQGKAPSMKVGKFYCLSIMFLCNYVWEPRRSPWARVLLDRVGGRNLGILVLLLALWLWFRRM